MNDKTPPHERKEEILRAALAVAMERGLDGLTVRAVAEKAGMSHGLVHFYFDEKETLIVRLLDKLLEDVALRRATGGDRSFRGLVSTEMERAVRDRDRIGLFFDFWVLGLRRPEIRSRVRQELRRYRDWFREAAERAESSCAPASTQGHGGSVRPEAAAAMAVALVQGATLQSIVDPESFDASAVMALLDAMFPPAQ